MNFRNSFTDWSHGKYLFGSKIILSVLCWLGSMHQTEFTSKYLMKPAKINVSSNNRINVSFNQGFSKITVRRNQEQLFKLWLLLTKCEKSFSWKVSKNLKLCMHCLSGKLEIYKKMFPILYEGKVKNTSVGGGW